MHICMYVNAYMYKVCEYINVCMYVEHIQVDCRKNAACTEQGRTALQGSYVYLLLVVVVVVLALLFLATRHDHDHNHHQILCAALIFLS